MSDSDPRRQLRTGGDRGRMDRPPGWADSLFAGRSRADREADQDAMLRVLLVLGGVVVMLLVGLHALFTTVGLQLGWWSAPAFALLLLWLFACAACNRVLRPVELDETRLQRDTTPGTHVSVTVDPSTRVINTASMHVPLNTLGIASGESSTARAKTVLSHYGNMFGLSERPDELGEPHTVTDQMGRLSRSPWKFVAAVRV